MRWRNSATEYYDPTERPQSADDLGILSFGGTEMRSQAIPLLTAALVAILAACAAPAPPPSAQISQANSYELLNEALARAEIDDEQALVYKIFASFNDPQLPAQYKGDDAELHDGLVVAETLARWDELAPETQAIIAPFTLWPGEPGSWLQLRVAERPLALAEAIALPPVPILPVEGSSNVRAWYRQDRPGDLALAQAIIGQVDGEIWPKLTGLMGPPLSDLGLGNPEGNGEDGRIDIVLTGEDIRSFARPFGCQQTSGSIQLGVDDTIPVVVTHELMHVIQFKYPVTTGCQDPEYGWLHEAGAQWSIDYVYPQSQAERGKTGLLPQKCFLDVPGYPLELSNDCHEYAAYLLLQYLSHSYSPSYIPGVWEAAAGEDSLGAINSVVASAGGLAEVWPDFALAAYNVDPSKRFQQWDAFSHGARVIEQRVALDGANSREFTARGDVEHLAALYTGFRFEDSNIKRVVFSQPFTGNPAARVTAVVKLEGEDWQVEDWTPFPEKRFCYDDPGQKRLEQLVIMVSNSNFEDRGDVLSGAQPKLQVEDTCGGGQGTVTITRAKHGTYTSNRNNPVQVDVTDVATITFDLVADEYSLDLFSATTSTVTWSYSLSATESADGCAIVERAEGGGTFSGEGGPGVTLGVESDGTIFGFKINEDAYMITIVPPGSPEMEEGDPRGYYRVWSDVCGIPGIDAWWLYPVLALVSGMIPEDGGALTGRSQRTLPPLSGLDLPSTETVTWNIRLDGVPSP